MAFTAKQKLSDNAKWFFSHGIASDEITELIYGVQIMDNKASDMGLEEIKKALQPLKVHKKYKVEEIKHWCRHALKDIEAGDELSNILNGGFQVLSWIYDGDETTFADEITAIQSDIIKPFSERSRLYLIHACGDIGTADEIIGVLHDFALIIHNLDSAGTDSDNEPIIGPHSHPTFVPFQQYWAGTIVYHNGQFGRFETNAAGSWAGLVANPNGITIITPQQAGVTVTEQTGDMEVEDIEETRSTDPDDGEIIPEYPDQP